MIYKLTKKELSKELINFSKTYYGKVQFLLSYIVFFVSFLALIIELYRYSKSSYEYCYLYPLLYVLVFITLLSFVLGSIHYYKELKEYVNFKR